MANTDKINLRFAEGWEVDPARGVFGRSLGLFKHEYKALYYPIMALPFIVLAGYEAVYGSKFNFFGYEAHLTPGFAAFLGVFAGSINRTANKAIKDLELISRREMRDARA